MPVRVSLVRTGAGGATSMTASTTTARDVLSYRRTDDIRPNPLNPRGPVVEDDDLRDLADSIRAQGILQPLIVTPDGLLIAGHRRLAAAALAGCDTVPCIERDLVPAAQIATMIVENSHRRDLEPLRLAAAYQLLHDSGMADADIGQMVGKHPSWIGQYRKLLSLPEVAREPLAAGAISPTVGIALTRFAAKPEILDRLVSDVRRYGLSANAINSLNEDGVLRRRNARVPQHTIDPRDLTGDSASSRDEARLAERWRIAEWLREQARAQPTRETRTVLFTAAQGVEQGRYLTATGASQR